SAGATSLGDWVVDTTQWQVPADGVVNSVSITSAYDGSLVDRVTIETSATVSAPPQLTIQRVGADGRQVQISWPASYANMALESSVNPANAAGWTAVQATVQVSGNVRSVTVDAVGAAQ